ncbi:MAG: DUF58 domain-containing protein [Chloroflexota bacterium]
MRYFGRLLFALYFIIGLVGMISIGSSIFSRLVYFGIIFVFYNWLSSVFSLNNISLKRQARSLRASVGDVFEENYEISNTSRISKPFIEIINRSSLLNASGSKLLTWIGANEKRRYSARSWLTQRGVFLLGPTELHSGDPFGLFSIRKTIAAETELLVLPMVIPIDDFANPAGFLPGGNSIERKSFEITAHASSIREYFHGDALKIIHWPTTARKGKLMVKEFDQDPQSEFWIFLDAQQSAHASLPYQIPKYRDNWIFSTRPELQLPPATIEYAVSLAASLAHFFISKRKAVGLVTEGSQYTVIPAERSERQEGKILETLAFALGNGKLPLSSIVGLQAAQMQRGSCAILISPAVTNDLLLAIDILQMRKIIPVVLLLAAHSFGGKEGSEAIAKRIEARGVFVERVYNSSNIREILTKFAEKINASENRIWQNPQLR